LIPGPRRRLSASRYLAPSAARVPRPDHGFAAQGIYLFVVLPYQECVGWALLCGVG
jgi:hypothetical protein